ncbi:MAG TPA: NAD-dependent dehydratase, partial [Cyanophyceae cyanobacterium]
GQAVTLIDVVETIAEVIGKKADYTISGRFRVGDVRHAIADMEHYKTLLGQWTPTSLKDGIAQYLQWYLGQEPLEQATLEASLREMEQKGLLMKKQ